MNDSGESAAHDLARLRAGDWPIPDDDSPAARRDDDAWRANVTQALLADLRPGDHALALWLLRRETAALARGDSADLETLFRLVAAVARFAQPDDALLIWRAAQATTETRAGVDVEQALRAGPGSVLHALQRYTGSTDAADAADAEAALAWVQEGIANGAASDLPAYFAWSDERFGLHVSGPT